VWTLSPFLHRLTNTLPLQQHSRSFPSERPSSQSFLLDSKILELLIFSTLLQNTSWHLCRFPLMQPPGWICFLIPKKPLPLLSNLSVSKSLKPYFNYLLMSKTKGRYHQSTPWLVFLLTSWGISKHITLHQRDERPFLSRKFFGSFHSNDKAFYFHTLHSTE
jgi:hypothetical protein